MRPFRCQGAGASAHLRACTSLSNTQTPSPSTHMHQSTSSPIKLFNPGCWRSIRANSGDNHCSTLPKCAQRGLQSSQYQRSRSESCNSLRCHFAQTFGFLSQDINEEMTQVVKNEREKKKKGRGGRGTLVSGGGGGGEGWWLIRLWGDSGGNSIKRRRVGR